MRCNIAFMISSTENTDVIDSELYFHIYFHNYAELYIFFIIVFLFIVKRLL